MARTPDSFRIKVPKDVAHQIMFDDRPVYNGLTDKWYRPTATYSPALFGRKTKLMLIFVECLPPSLWGSGGD